MWLLTLFIMITQFALIGLIIAVIAFALAEWFKQDGPDPIS